MGLWHGPVSWGAFQVFPYVENIKNNPLTTTKPNFLPHENVNTKLILLLFKSNAS